MTSEKLKQTNKQKMPLLLFFFRPSGSWNRLPTKTVMPYLSLSDNQDAYIIFLNSVNIF